MEKLPLALVFVAVLTFACGPRTRESGAESSVVTQRSAPVNPAAPLTSTLDVTVTRGVRFAFDVTNAGSRTLEVRFPDGRTHDLIVLDSLEREVWRWSEGRLFTQAVQNRVMRVSDAMTFADEWPAARPGRYTAVARLVSTNYPVEQRVAFTVR